MAITVEAIYENGMLKPLGPLPLRDQDKVRVTVEPVEDLVSELYGLMGWTGDPEVIEFFAESPELEGQEGAHE